MKLSKYLVGTLACALMAGCANEDTPAVDNGTQAQEGSSYMAVNLVMSTDAASRAATDGGFENGTAEEGAVSIANSVFLFYDAAGNYLTKGNIVTDDDSDSDGGSVDGFLDLNSESQDGKNELESKSNAVIVLGPTASQPTQVLAVLNGGNSALAGLSLSEAIARTTTSGLGTTKGTFLMTNATYVSGTEIVNATTIDPAVNLKETAEEAKADGAFVNIYVERVAAKLTVKESVPEKELSGDGYVLDNTTGATMKVIIDGWCANATNKSSYYVKNLDNEWLTTNPFTSWTGTHRTFWAKDMNYAGTGAYPSGPTYNGLEYKTWNETAPTVGALKSEDYTYVFENTINNTEAEVEGGDNTNVTTVLVAAHIVYKKAGESDYSKPADIFKQNGVYYTEQGLTNVIVATSDYYWYYTKDETETWTPLKANDVTFSFSNLSTEPNPGVVTVDVTAITKPTIEGVTNIILVKGEGTKTETTIENAITALEGSTYTQNLMGYKEGKCYYQIPIEHLSSTAGAEFYGVVRNHSYVLTISDITGIGGAIYDPDKELPLIPGKDKNYYMAAKLNVLAWKVVEQSAVLN